jgi:hypothetical protein
MGERGPMLSRELADLVHGGVAVSIATRDAALRPAFTRGWGPKVAEDGRTLTVCVTAPQGPRAVRTSSRTERFAIGFSPPTIARALQVKGSVVEQHADFFAGPDNSRGEVIVRKNNVVWVLTVENCGPSAPLPAGAPRILQR